MELTLPQVKTLVAVRLGLALASRHPLAGDKGEGPATPARPSLWTPFDTGFTPAHPRTGFSPGNVERLLAVPARR